MSNRAKPVVAFNIRDPRRMKVSTSIRGMSREIGIIEETIRKDISRECSTGGGEVDTGYENGKWYVEYY